MQIDRVMDSFAAHYCAQNPNIFEERDTCFILSFSIIMLNTALHNPNAKIKISAEQFVKQNRGINSGRDLPNDMLEAIYRNIKEEPFKIPDETYDDLMYTFFSPEREGWLMKQVLCFQKFFLVTNKFLAKYQPGGKLEELEETVVCFERSLPLLFSGFKLHFVLYFYFHACLIFHFPFSNIYIRNYFVAAHCRKCAERHHTPRKCTRPFCGRARW